MVKQSRHRKISAPYMPSVHREFDGDICLEARLSRHTDAVLGEGFTMSAKNTREYGTSRNSAEMSHERSMYARRHALVSCSCTLI